MGWSPTISNGFGVFKQCMLWVWNITTTKNNLETLGVVEMLVRGGTSEENGENTEILSGHIGVKKILILWK